MGNNGPWPGVDIPSPSTGMGHSLTGKGGYINVLEKHIHLYMVVHKRKRLPLFEVTFL